MKNIYSRKSPDVRHVPNGIAISGVEPLDLAATFDCGQTFRWKPDTGNSFMGIVAGKIIIASKQNNELVLKGASLSEADFWIKYFALDIDYTSLQNKLKSDAILRKCVDFSPGIRVLRQEFFETLITFIISQNNNIPRIRGIVERLCANFGEPVKGRYAQTGLNAFPAAERLAECSDIELAPLRAGYRVAGIIDASKKIASGEIKEEELLCAGFDDARKRLLSIYGVGPKIADCVLLFGLGRFESFPADVWIKRAMENLFPGGLPNCAADVEGIAQQYIFHYVRSSGFIL